MTTSNNNLGRGDSTFHPQFMSPDFAQHVYHRVIEEVQFQDMFVSGKKLCRLGVFQVDIRDDGTYPLIRCPSAEDLVVRPFALTIAAIRDQLEAHFKVPFNHVKIQIYKDYDSFIEHHSDKTIDLAQETPNLNYRIGATRDFIITLNWVLSPTGSGPMG